MKWRVFLLHPVFLLEEKKREREIIYEIPNLHTDTVQRQYGCVVKLKRDLIKMVK